MTSPANSPSLTHDSNELAADYDRVSATRQFESGKRLVAELAIGRGERVLDIGCGTGLLAQHIADLVGPTGRVLGIDPLPLRIELAKAKARANLAFQVGDAYDLAALPDGSFDVVVINAVFHWLPEKTAPLVGCARLLRPGGRIGISTGLKGNTTDLHRLMAAAMAEPPFDRYPFTRKSVTFRVDAAEMRALFEATGFQPTLIEERPTEQHHPSPEAAVRYSEASSFGNLFAHLPDDLKPAARQAMARRLAVINSSQGIVQHGQRLVAVATRRRHDSPRTRRRRAVKQVTTAIGIVLMILSAAALLLTVRNFVHAMRFSGPSGAYNSAQVVFYGVFALATLLIAAALLRHHLRRRAPRLIFAAATIAVVVAGIGAGYVG